MTEVLYLSRPFKDYYKIIYYIILLTVSGILSYNNLDTHVIFRFFSGSYNIIFIFNLSCWRLQKGKKSYYSIQNKEFCFVSNAIIFYH
jgi:hypothetical protein